MIALLERLIDNEWVFVAITEDYPLEHRVRCIKALLKAGKYSLPENISKGAKFWCVDKKQMEFLGFMKVEDAADFLYENLDAPEEMGVKEKVYKFFKLWNTDYKKWRVIFAS